MTIRALALCAIVLLSGCAKTVYRWEGYDRHLETYLKHPDRVDQYSASLERLIARAKETSTRVPPGVYAEYGRILYDRQEYRAAIECFNLEKSSFPESAVFMDGMIARAAKLSGETP